MLSVHVYVTQTRYLRLKMADVIEDKIKNYRTAPFDARFPNTNQTRNCFQNYLGKNSRNYYMNHICTQTANL